MAKSVSTDLKVVHLLILTILFFLFQVSKGPLKVLAIFSKYSCLDD